MSTTPKRFDIQLLRTKSSDEMAVCMDIQKEQDPDHVWDKLTIQRYVGTPGVDQPHPNAKRNHANVVVQFNEGKRTVVGLLFYRTNPEKETVNVDKILARDNRIDVIASMVDHLRTWIEPKELPPDGREMHIPHYRKLNIRVPIGNKDMADYLEGEELMNVRETTENDGKTRYVATYDAHRTIRDRPVFER